MPTCTIICIGIYMCNYIYIYLCIWLSPSIYICIHIYAHTYTYIYIYTHTRISLHIHTHTHPYSLSRWRTRTITQSVPNISGNLAHVFLIEVWFCFAPWGAPSWSPIPGPTMVSTMHCVGMIWSNLWPGSLPEPCPQHWLPETSNKLLVLFFWTLEDTHLHMWTTYMCTH